MDLQCYVGECILLLDMQFVFCNMLAMPLRLHFLCIPQREQSKGFCLLVGFFYLGSLYCWCECYRIKLDNLGIIEIND